MPPVVILPEEPQGLEREQLAFSTRSGLVVARGYNRLLWGGRGPYVEFDNRHVVHSALHIPVAESWRENSPRSYYVEYRSRDISNIKVYHQKKLVCYADYQIGKFYVSPVDLIADKYGELIVWR